MGATFTSGKGVGVTTVIKAIAHTREFTNSLIDPIGKRFIQFNYSCADGPFLLTHVAPNHALQVRSIGFFITNANNYVSLA